MYLVKIDPNEDIEDIKSELIHDGHKTKTIIKSKKISIHDPHSLRGDRRSRKPKKKTQNANWICNCTSYQLCSSKAVSEMKYPNQMRNQKQTMKCLLRKKKKKQ